MNLADLPAVDRRLIEADKIACMIRHQAKGMSKRDRQIHAQAALDKLSADMREMVLQKMKERANAN